MTRGNPTASLENLSLFTIFLPSFVRTAEPGLEYWIYIAFDEGDSFFADGPKRDAVDTWMATHVRDVMKAKGVVVRWATLRFFNPMRKPGPVMNFMMAATHADGADFMYRINDDTEFISPWAWSAIATLRGFSPPLLGVVGPICLEGKTSILTHDFVHRQHLDIFKTYYPAVFTDWWLDDWISMVYGARRTHKGPFQVTHHWRHQDGKGHHYEVSHNNQGKVPGEITAGSRHLAS